MDIHPGDSVGYCSDGRPSRRDGAVADCAGEWEKNTFLLDCVAEDRETRHAETSSQDHVSMKTPSYGVYDGSVQVATFCGNLTIYSGSLWWPLRGLKAHKPRKLKT